MIIRNNFCQNSRQRSGLKARMSFGYLLISITFIVGCSVEQEVEHRGFSQLTMVHPDPDKSVELAAPMPGSAQNNDPATESSTAIIGLDADMTSGSAASGEAIRRGIELATVEINEQGGLLGVPLEIVVRDHRGNPDRGVDNIREFAQLPNLLAVVGGIHTPVALQELPTIHELKVLYLSPWAAGTPIVANGYSPNYVFRVSVRDEYAGGFLVDQALQRDLNKVGLLLERTAWGRSNETAITHALKTCGLEPTRIEWLNWGEVDVTMQLQELVKADSQVVLLVCNPLEGATVVKSMAAFDSAQRLPIISHWGISAGDFFQLVKPELQSVDIAFLQSFSFISPKYPDRVAPIIEAYLQRNDDCQSTRDIFSPVGTAQAYELVMMAAQAVRECGSLAPAQVRSAMESLTAYRGIIRDYQHPFPPEHHDALDVSDFTLARFDDSGAIIPVAGEQSAAGGH